MQLILASQSEGRKKLLSLLKIPFKIIPSSLDEEKIIGKTPLVTLQMRAKMKGEEVAKRVQGPGFIVHGKKSSLLSTINYQPSTNFLILSADSGAILGNLLIEKPKDYQDAVRILKILSGKTHEFVTAVYAIKISKIKAGGTSENYKHPKIPIFKDTNSMPPINQSFLGGDTWRDAPPWVKGGHRNLKGLGVSEKFGIEGATIQTYARSFVTFRKLTRCDIRLYLSLTDYTKYAAGYTLSATPQSFITRVEGSLTNVIGLPLEKVMAILKKLDIRK